MVICGSCNSLEAVLAIKLLNEEMRVFLACSWWISATLAGRTNNHLSSESDDQANTNSYTQTLGDGLNKQLAP